MYTKTKNIMKSILEKQLVWHIDTDVWTLSARCQQRGLTARICAIALAVAGYLFGSWSLSAQTSDDFSGNGLDTSVWTFVNPLGDATLDASGLSLSISVPAGSSHDNWTSGFNAPRVMQAVNDTDFEIEAKFQSEVTQKYQSQGDFCRAGRDERDSIRCVFHWQPGASVCGQLYERGSEHQD